MEMFCWQSYLFGLLKSNKRNRYLHCPADNKPESAQIHTFIISVPYSECLLCYVRKICQRNAVK